MKNTRWLECIVCFSLLFTTAIPASAAIPPPGNIEGTEDLTSVLLSLAGDCVLGGEEKTCKSDRSFDNLIAQKGMAWPFFGLHGLFAKDDITLVNLEVVLQDNRGPQHRHRGYYKRQH